MTGILPGVSGILHGCVASQSSGYALPDGSEPLILADFKNGVYMISGEAVPLGDILSENEAIWGSFDPALIQAGVGLVCDTDFPDSNVALVGDMLDLARGEMTMVMECNLNASAFALCGFVNRDVPDGDNHCRFSMNGINGGDAAQVSLYAKQDNGGTPSGGAEIGGLLPGMVNGLNRVAWTRTVTGLAVSVNGGAVTTYPGTPFLLKNEFNDFAGFFVTGNGCVLTEFLVASPQADADLPALSAFA